jgi:hypothetical protein
MNQNSARFSSATRVRRAGDLEKQEIISRELNSRYQNRSDFSPRSQSAYDDIFEYSNSNNNVESSDFRYLNSNRSIQSRSSMRDVFTPTTGFRHSNHIYPSDEDDRSEVEELVIGSNYYNKPNFMNENTASRTQIEVLRSGKNYLDNQYIDSGELLTERQQNIRIGRPMSVLSSHGVQTSSRLAKKGYEMESIDIENGDNLFMFKSVDIYSKRKSIESIESFEANSKYDRSKNVDVHPVYAKRNDKENKGSKKKEKKKNKKEKDKIRKKSYDDNNEEEAEEVAILYFKMPFFIQFDFIN